jgi:hypothetical protein
LCSCSLPACVRSDPAKATQKFHRNIESLIASALQTDLGRSVRLGFRVVGKMSPDQVTGCLIQCLRQIRDLAVRLACDSCNVLGQYVKASDDEAWDVFNGLCRQVSSEGCWADLC